MRMQSKMTAPDQSLEALFAEARQHAPQPSDAFLSRLIDDAIAVQPNPQPQPQARAARGYWSRLFGAIGGAAVVVGMGSAAMAGLVIGYAQPEEMLQFSDTIGLSESQQIEILPNFDIFLTEEASQ